MGQKVLGCGSRSPERWLLHPAACETGGDTQAERRQPFTGIPTVNDRVIQQAIAQVLNPIIDPGFSESSYGFRPERNAHGAVRQVKGFIKAGYKVAVDVDLSKFFDQVNHDILMIRVSRHIADKRLIKLIGRYLRAGVEIDGVRHPTSGGGCHKAAPYHRCWRMWCWMIWTNFWNPVRCALPVMPMILSSV